MNPEIKISTYSNHLTPENALDIIENYDIVVDAMDNFPSRYMINDACILMRKPLVYGAVSNFEGQVAVFNVSLDNGINTANYRDIFPNPPKENEIGNCAEIGVLGVLPGTIGCIQASEVIKLIIGIGKPLTNQFQTVNLLTNHWQTFNIKPSMESLKRIPSNAIAFKNQDYNLSCDTNHTQEINGSDLYQYFDRDDVVIIDVREMYEIPEIDSFKYENHPLTKWSEYIPDFKEDIIIIFCQTGKRSLEAAKALSKKYKDKSIFSLKNGILHWQNNFKNIGDEQS